MSLERNHKAKYPKARRSSILAKRACDKKCAELRFEVLMRQFDIEFDAELERAFAPLMQIGQEARSCQAT